MKNIAKILVLSSFVLPLAAHAEDSNDFCKPIFTACAAQGYVKDETAPAGKKIWLNCADVIINQKKAVDKVDMPPASWDVKNCRDYREAKEKFDANWAKSHKKAK